MTGTGAPILALTADWHVAPGAWKRKGVLGDAKAALAAVVDWCLVARTPLLAAGDLFDVDDPDPESVGFVFGQCDRLRAADLPLLFIVGQHERRREGTWMGAHPWPIHVGDGRAVEVPTPDGGSAVVRGFDWTPASGIPGILETFAADPACDVLMLHQVCAELMGATTGGACELRLADLPGSTPVLVGDYHVSIAKEVGGRSVYSPGSLALQEIDADPAKSFFAFRRDGTADRVPLPTRPVARYEIATADELDAFLAARPWEGAFGDSAVPEGLRKPIAAVRYPAGLAGAHRRLLAALDGIVHYFPRPVAEARPTATPATARGAATLFDALAAEVPEGTAVRALLARLLATGPDRMEAELAAIRGEFLEAAGEGLNGAGDQDG